MIINLLSHNWGGGDDLSNSISMSNVLCPLIDVIARQGKGTSKRKNVLLYPTLMDKGIAICFSLFRSAFGYHCGTGKVSVARWTSHPLFAMLAACRCYRGGICCITAISSFGQFVFFNFVLGVELEGCPRRVASESSIFRHFWTRWQASS